jgi:hypothetical protein
MPPAVSEGGTFEVTFPRQYEADISSVPLEIMTGIDNFLLNTAPES